MKNWAIILLVAVFVTNAFSDDFLVPNEFNTIQEAINAAQGGDRVIVSRGEYIENIVFGGKAITVASNYIETNDWADVTETIINGRNGAPANATGSVVRFINAETADAKLIGFTLTGGKGVLMQGVDTDTSGGGIAIYLASPTIESCRITGNTATFGAGVWIKSTAANANAIRPTFKNCHIFTNSALKSGGGVWISQNLASPTFDHCIIANNTAGAGGTVSGAGGIGAYQNCTVTIDFCTFAGNAASAARGSAIENRLGCSMTIRNSIIWTKNGNEKLIQGNSETTLNVDYCCVQTGDSAASGNQLVWGQNNVKGDPMFKDVINYDYNITWANYPLNDASKSGAIDAGNPQAANDKDGTRADLGALPFYQGVAVIYGQVTNAKDNEPLPDVKITTSWEDTTVTDGVGYYRIVTAPGVFEIKAHLNGYLDSLVAERVELNDSIEINFGLLYPDFTLSIEQIVTELDSGETTFENFSATNNGTGTVEYTVIKRARGALDVPAFGLIDSLVVGPKLKDKDLQGVAFLQDKFVIAGGYQSEDGNKNYIYVLDRDGNEIKRFKQWGTSLNGIYDLATDGNTVWGAEDQLIYHFDLEGALLDTFSATYKPVRCITYDTDRDVIWCVGRTSNRQILGYKPNGQAVPSIGAVGVSPYSLAYYPADPDGMPLYITSLDNNNKMVIHKMNPDIPETLRVESPFDASKQEGGEMTNAYHPAGFWTYISIGETAANDEIEIRLIASDLSWFELAPIGWGTILPGQTQEFQAFLDGNIGGGDYEGQFVFTHTATGGTNSIPVSLHVNPGPPPEDPPDIDVLPGAEQKFYAHAGEYDIWPIIVKNLGERKLSVSAQSIPEQFTPFTITSGGGAYELAPGDSHITVVRFDPQFEFEFQATFKIVSNDPDEGTVNVNLIGITVYDPKIGVESEEDLPRVFEISSIYPSPFNSTATIRYSLTEKSHTTVGVFDVTGRMVAELVNRDLPAGYHSAIVNANHLPTGLYFVRLTAGNRIDQQKIILVR